MEARIKIKSTDEFFILARGTISTKTRRKFHRPSLRLITIWLLTILTDMRNFKLQTKIH